MSETDKIQSKDEKEILQFVDTKFKTALTTSRLLLEKEFADPIWVVNDLIPEGFTIFAGKPKSGKSFLALQLADAVSVGTQFLLNFKVTKSRVLYLALEDNDRRLQRRLNIIKALPTNDLLLTTIWDRADGAGATGLHRFLGSDTSIKLVIIDTLGAFLPYIDFNSYSDTYTALNVLKQTCEDRKVSIILIHHTRKSQGVDFIDNVSGSNAFTGVADTIMELSRGRGDADGFVRLVGRDIDDKEIALNLEQDVGWKYLGAGMEYRMNAERKKIYDFLVSAASEQTASDINNAVKGDYGCTIVTLCRMVNDMQITRVRRGIYKV